ncbi:MAG: iron-sulfur cluster assembly accessory protein [Geitlerinemataceae cyanobacterium]
MIHLSPTAIRELNRIQSKQGTSLNWFRLKIDRGGCSQFVYEMEFVVEPQPDDRRCEYEGLQVAIEASSLPQIEGLTLDYTEDLMGGGFQFKNPNAKQVCGCGNSFSVDEGVTGGDCIAS